ncbi:hypothetical protein ACFVUN_35910 [Kitasatospora griseola]|uniref:hypothetical protein n=1 Tax=Kitasatospora griseola TaxID=2064 RepID=UPI0036D8D189
MLTDPLNDDQMQLLVEVWDVFANHGRFPTYRYVEYALGCGLVHLTWPDFPGVRGGEQCGRLVGWAEERGFAAGAWSTLLDGRRVIDAADNHVLLSGTPADAVTPWS